MRQEYVTIIFYLQIVILCVSANEIPIYNIQHVGHIKPYSRLTSLERNHKQYCFWNNKWVECSAIPIYNLMNSFTKNDFYDPNPFIRVREFNSNLKSYFSEPHPVHRRFYRPNPINIRSLPDAHIQGRLPAKTYQMHRPAYTSANYYKNMQRPEMRHNMNNALSMPHPHHPHASSGLSAPTQSAQVNSSSNVAHGQLTVKPSVTMAVPSIAHKILPQKNVTPIEKFTLSLDQFERQFYLITFTKLTTISPTDRQENGMSFAQSGFFLLLTLMAFSSEVDLKTRAEIDRCIGFRLTDTDNIDTVRHFISTMPESSDKLKLRWSSRLMLWPGREVGSRFRAGEAAALKLYLDRFDGTETSDKIATILNQKVEMDSGGAIRDTFDEEDVSGNVTAVLVTTMYVRGCWRAAPTVLNGTRPFRDHVDAPQRTVRMIRINDHMNYVDLKEWDAQALEISYATPGLTLLMLIPRGNSLRSLVHHVTNSSIGDITGKMRTKRVAATVPLYTLRMTLLLPNKLQAMGIPTLVDVSNITQTSSLRLSHAVQRIMFWAEAGRNAYKDDGIEWDQAPDLEVVVDRPYIFFVRWRNITLLNGNFVL